MKAAFGWPRWSAAIGRRGGKHHCCCNAASIIRRSPSPSQRRHPHPAGHLLLASYGPRTERAVAAAVGSAECASRSSDRAIPGLALLPQAHFLPAYAPDLNPIEYAWCYLKMKSLANSPHFDLPALTHTTRRQTRSLQRKPDLLGSFLSHSPLFCNHDRTLLIQD